MNKSLFTLAALCCTLMMMAAEPKVTKETRTVPAQKPSEEIDQKTQLVSVFMDTAYTYTKTTTKREIPQKEDTSFTRKGHYIQALIGGGYGSMGYNLTDVVNDLKNATNNGGGNGLIQLNYVYYFHENVGFMLGLEFEHMNSYSVLNGTKTWKSQGDSDGQGEDYEHIVTMNDWKEKQVTYLLGLPIGFQFQWPIAKMPNATSRNNQLRMYADLGAKVNYVVAQQYKPISGSITHSGYYDKWNLYLEGITDRDYYNEEIGKEITSVNKKMNLSNISVDGMVDLGFMIPVAERLDVMVGLYANYTFNNLKSSNKEIGWRNTSSNAKGTYREHAFMETYDGVIATDYVKAVRPWDVGVKVGISWNAPAKKKKYETLVAYDTTYQLVRREEEEKRVAAKKINEIMKKSVIWFDFDSDKPKLQPADVIDKIAAVLLEHPEQKVLVYGHCSKEGSMEYNQNLSERRAASIVRLLKKKGIPETQMFSKGFSYTQQYDDSENPYHNIALDRRVEIIPVFDEDKIAE